MNATDSLSVDELELPDPKVPEAGFQACGFTFGVRAVSCVPLDNGVIGLPASLARAVPKRQAEFLAGRFCAYRACDTLGAPLTDLPIGPDRAPVWPESLVGSITHSDGVAAALIGPKRRYRGLGLDVEGVISDASIDALQSLVVSDGELAALDSLRGERQALTVLFSAKEAIYKAIQPTVKRYVDFKEVHCREMNSGWLMFSMEDRLASEFPDLSHIEVHLVQSTSLVMTWCVIEQTGVV